MPYLPDDLPKAHILITVKTYPLPSHWYGETVCTAGLLDGEKWVRIYPVSYRLLNDDQMYPKYAWIELDLIRNTSDFRPESYKPRKGIDEQIAVLTKIGTANAWAARKQYVLKEVFTSITDLTSLAKSETAKSLATFKPKEIVDFVIEDDEREWKQTWLNQFKQTNLFDLDEKGRAKQRELVKKLPFQFKYRFLSADDKISFLTIQDWEIGGLFWNCLKNVDGDEEEAKRLVRQKYFDEFVNEKDIYFYLGTTYQFHRRRMPNPFIIVGVFYPPKTPQLSLF